MATFPLRRIEARAEHHRAQHVGVERIRLLERLGEHVDLEIGGLDAHIGRFALPVALLVALHGGGIGLALDALEIGSGGDVVLADIEAHGADLGLGRREAGDRHAARIEACFAKAW